MRIQNEKELLEKLITSVQNTEKEEVAIIAGHFPVIYEQEGAKEHLDLWGQFTRYSLELGVEVAKAAKEAGKTPRFLFVGDDHSYRQMSNLGSGALSSRRKNFFQNASGEEGNIHPEIEEILAYGGFSTDDVVRHDQGKNGREDSLYFSEIVLRNSTDATDNGCAREYVVLIEETDYINKEKDHLVGFIPNKCQGHISDLALDELITGLSATHVFMETSDPFASREELYSGLRGVTLRED